VTLYFVILLVLGALASFGLVFTYIKTQKGWWKSPFGKMLIILAACDGIFYVWYLIVAAFPNIPGRQLIRLFLFTALTAALVYRYFAFLHLTRVVKRDKELQENEVL